MCPDATVSSDYGKRVCTGPAPNRAACADTPQADLVFMARTTTKMAVGTENPIFMSESIAMSVPEHLQ